MKRLAIAFACVGCVCAAGLGHADDERPEGLDRWKFLIGDWNLVERRYGFDSKLIQTNAGHATFSYAMNGQRIQELQTVVSGEDTATALHLFVYDPRSEKIEIARTDSGHYGFWIISGTMSDDRIDLAEEHPDPQSEITRRITYLRLDDGRFRRQLEFSQDRGESWFVRSEWSYTRERASSP